jgi:hypothetical protein
LGDTVAKPANSCKGKGPRPMLASFDAKQSFDTKQSRGR